MNHATAEDESIDEMPVREVARRTGVTTAAVNFYVRKGLIPKPRKTARTRALYSERHVDLICRIRDLQAQGFPLRLISRILEERVPVTAAPTQKPGETFDFQTLAAKTGLTASELERASRVGLIQRRPHVNRGRYDAEDLAAALAVAHLRRLGVSFEILSRHAREFEPLTRAEAHFFAEHVAAARATHRGTVPGTEVATAFCELRDYLRRRSFAQLYPEWPL